MCCICAPSQRRGSLWKLSHRPWDYWLVPQAVGQLDGAGAKSQAVTPFDDAPPEPLTRLGRSSNIILIEKVRDPATRLWYARKAMRSEKAITNFEHTLLPKLLSGELSVAGLESRLEAVS
jgi:hypothetical protein